MTAPEIVPIRTHHGKVAGVILRQATLFSGVQHTMPDKPDNLDRSENALERRSLGRTKILKGALLFFSEKAGVHSCTVRDVTNVGAGIRAQDLKVVPLQFALSFDNFRTIRMCRLIWRQADFLGVAFES